MYSLDTRGTLIIRIGFGAHYTIVIIGSPPNPIPIFKAPTICLPVPKPLFKPVLCSLPHKTPHPEPRQATLFYWLQAGGRGTSGFAVVDSTVFRPWVFLSRLESGRFIAWSVYILRFVGWGFGVEG